MDIEWSTLASQTPPAFIPYLPGKDSDSGNMYSSQVRLIGARDVSLFAICIITLRSFRLPV